MKQLFLKQILCVGIILFCLSHLYADKKGIQPWSENPHYWQYKGKPLLLIGGTDNDNLFQLKNLRSHLDSLARCGGNYVRNTMSDRDLNRGDVRAFKKVKGKYDLEQWNPIYWSKFENLLRWSEERNIIVQIEIWDRFDHSKSEWYTDPYNPANNSNYTYQQTGLKKEYPNHPGANDHPFFYTVPTLDNNSVLLRYQQRFVDKLLSISLNYKNVLYCMDNETSGDEKWGQYWAKYIREKAGSKKLFLTEMWDNWNVVSSFNKTYSYPDIYNFIDISQNSHQEGYVNWKNAQSIFYLIKEQQRPCPVNSVKIYGSKKRSQGVGEQHAIATFFRNLLGGFAASRFHRPTSGLGLSQTSMLCMTMVRKLEEKVKFWNLTPAMNLIKNPLKGNAYITKSRKGNYLLYVTNQESIKLNLEKEKHYKIQWIGLMQDKWAYKKEIMGNQEVKSPYKKNSFALIFEK